MPAKNSVKRYVENGYYHIYNRGVNKRKIFKNTRDYKVFLSYLKEYLSPPVSRANKKTICTFKGATFKGVPRLINNYNKEIELIAYCLMPNHFHLLLKQVNSRSVTNFLRSIMTRYSMYFNKEHSRVGALFQGIYKGVCIENEQYLLWLSRYIHRNPLEYRKDLTTAYSSYSDYLSLRKTKWVRPEIVLGYFNHQSYKNFVEDKEQDNEFILTDSYTLES